MKNLLLFLCIALAKSIFAQTDSVAVQPALPLKIVGIETRTANTNIQLFWTVSGNEDARSYEIERSSDGISFQKIGSKLSNGKTGTEVYEFVDAFLKKQTGFSYRIKIIAKDGSTAYSDVQAISDDLLQAVLKQNPVRNNIELQLEVHDATLLQAEIYTSYGQKLKAELAKLTAGANNISINAQNLAAGLYRLVLTNSDKRQVISFVKE